MQDPHRLKVLDGFRAIAILLVIGFHYFVRWTPPMSPVNLYPYGDVGARFWVFEYGYLGVELFFIISGFVISMTLFRCRTIGQFALKRFARLFPTMLLCSVLTFVLVAMLPQSAFNPQLRDFLPSLSFTDPFIWSKLFGGDFKAIDGSYWSLAVEVKFYLWISLLYFSVGGARFFRSAAWMFGALVTASVLMRVLNVPHRWGLDFIFALDALPWFVAGIGFFALYRDHASRIGWLLLAEAALALLALQMADPAASLAPLAALPLFYGLFLAMLLRPGWVAWLAFPPLAAVGVASYSLYLLHQDVGVAVLHAFQGALGTTHPALSALLVPLVTGTLIGMSLLIYRYWEAPSRDFLLARRTVRPEPLDPVPLTNRPDVDAR
ncbi:MAG: acyltransferase [Betaproteobacteria bacterium]|uniref:acyltransferase family protein n=1 Tax=Thiomonas sp. TaxID=2047785 RepID=UPI00238F664C|nr:acyltransferase [Thiomonas sp.]MDE2129591.1 acyltransferase [Betaproteobacteria bacterium]